MRLSRRINYTPLIFLGGKLKKQFALSKKLNTLFIRYLRVQDTYSILESLEGETEDNNCYKKVLQNCPNVFTTPITAMGCRQCLALSVVQLKGKHCRKPHCHNGVVDTFEHGLL